MGYLSRGVVATFPTLWTSVSSFVKQGTVPEVPEDLPTLKVRALRGAQRAPGDQPAGQWWRQGASGFPPLSSGNGIAQLLCPGLCVRPEDTTM